jgi:tubulin epsilon
VSSHGGSGSGNNWAQGYVEHGERYIPDVLEAVRREAEACDSLQSFFLVHSLGGGTGAGLGTRAVAALADAYPEVYRFVAPVFPSEGDDVVTSPYNCVLGLNQLTEHADAVLPVDNECLAAIAAKIEGGGGGESASGWSGLQALFGWLFVLVGCLFLLKCCFP